MAVQLRPELDAIPNYVPGRSVPGAIKLASNEMPYPPLDAVVQAIAEAAAGSNRYPDMAVHALAERLAEHFNVDPSGVAVGCGSVALCQQIIQATCRPGDEVVFPWRSFEAYPILTQVVGATSVTVPLVDEALDLHAIGDAVTDRTRVIFVCSPNNPTGTAVSAAEVTAFLERLPPTVLVVLDEAYREFVDDPDGVDGLAIADGRPNVAVLRTLSKAYGLAGLRVGFSVSSAEVAAAVRKVGIPFAVNALAQAAAIAALGEEQEVRQRCDSIIEERIRVRAELLSMGYRVPRSQANFVWLPLRDRSAAFAAHTAAERILVRPFDSAENGGVRVTIGTPVENDDFLAVAQSFNSA